ncbi:hypothetical protein EMIHUDRAFT_218577 [Emiliania huxleyi CCMP1516]|uniref:protein-tyrosine-phosphatase n=2 Tax=Emiliania huxleyi TaxID=2903 RepID=A0A0D3I6K8_EMIH1|nr:hypothetical protein EMIHUDRAFT_218577 [Emiliania huxleyi CCMP1516]EOD06893.1 hypothetical protein EMIHUDRAFT_218577 [Emiliania huxleyi CCMP1516]|eukprot:XP_005759322.1 hypothetical protein EMIHUDRAFT_218577 [Emiliania huxleyi CCMP1516]
MGLILADLPAIKTVWMLSAAAVPLSVRRRPAAARLVPTPTGCSRNARNILFSRARARKKRAHMTTPNFSGRLLHGPFAVYVGDKEFARDRTRINRLNVRYIVNCTPTLSSGGVANFFEKDRALEYLRLPMRDANTESVLAHLPAAIDFFERARIRADGAVLIHCNEGKSRSCAVALGYVIISHGRALDEALEMLRGARPQAEPKEAFLAQLATLTPAVRDGVDVSRACKRAAESGSDEASRQIGRR